ncbi:neo-calmodulin-like [Mercenaria mercenaria]|uniref:neo-calmodulin-like n=1 Tax=Mercenaria mercenaria TaxID=6596 RepID=UPI00234EAAC1|nr:neo-calmodulin-like [Mercenaria mercenaria]XP_045181922.2 neo-calmodulin-like [Mercenaria mercenaria]XP_045181923.2 neo-calmodulin-like [Mercenaria mercenaria]
MEERIHPEQYKEFKEKQVFDLFDKNGDGHISGAELGNVLRALGQNPTEKEVQKILKRFDKNCDEKIQYNEYLDILKDYLKDPQIFEIELREAFRIFDRDRNNDLNFAELRKALTSLGEPLTDSEAIQLCKMMDADGDKKVTVDEAVKFMLRSYDEIFDEEQQCNTRGNMSQVQISTT